MWNTKGIDSIDAAVTQCQDTHNANNEMGKKVLCTRDDETYTERWWVGLEVRRCKQNIPVSINRYQNVQCLNVHLNIGQIAWTATHANRHTHSIANKRNKSDVVSFVLCLFLQLCFCSVFASLSFGFGYRFMCVIVLCSRFRKQNVCTSLLCLPSFGPFFSRCSLLLLLLCFNDFQ